MIPENSSENNSDRNILISFSKDSSQITLSYFNRDILFEQKKIEPESTIDLHKYYLKKIIEGKYLSPFDEKVIELNFPTESELNDTTFYNSVMSNIFAWHDYNYHGEKTILIAKFNYNNLKCSLVFDLTGKCILTTVKEDNSMDVFIKQFP
jgi:hypothetical protein